MFSKYFDPDNDIIYSSQKTSLIRKLLPDFNSA
jgi:hypothetical protein